MLYIKNTKKYSRFLNFAVFFIIGIFVVSFLTSTSQVEASYTQQVYTYACPDGTTVTSNFRYTPNNAPCMKTIIVPDQNNQNNSSNNINANNQNSYNNTGNGNNQNGYGNNGNQNAAPLIYNTNPNYIKAGSGAITINIIGNNFVSSSVVRLNSSDRPTTYISPTQLSANLTAADTANYATYPITVFTPAPGGGISNTVAFIVNDGTPVASLNMYSTDLASAGGTNSGNGTNTGINGNGGTGTGNNDGSVLGTNTGTTTTNNTSNTNNKNLTANASSGFFPWGFLFWILLAIAILLIVIIWRQAMVKKRKEEDKKPDVIGKVSAIVGKVITVIGTRGFEQTNPNKINISYTIDTTNAEIKDNGNLSNLSEIGIGDKLAIYGTITNADILANTIERLEENKEELARPDVIGKVSAIVGKVITVIGTRGFEQTNPNKINISYTIDTTNAEIRENDRFSDLSEITTGDELEIYGTIDNTHILATDVEKLKKNKEDLAINYH